MLTETTSMKPKGLSELQIESFRALILSSTKSLGSLMAVLTDQPEEMIEN